jgi:hypothetical protein
LAVSGQIASQSLLPRKSPAPAASDDSYSMFSE